MREIESACEHAPPPRCTSAQRKRV